MIDPTLRELLELVTRWIHLIAGIMWVGNSMIFNWLDRNLEKVQGSPERVIGEIWMLHSGGFYQVEKKYLTPEEVPRVLHWFKWQAYTTWISGFLLLALIYYLSGGAFLVDPAVMALDPTTASLLGVGLLVLGWGVYDLLWRSPLGTRHPPLATFLSFVLAAGMGVVLLQVFSARAAYIHIGTMLGTVMAGNVFFHIIPSQRQMVAATERGEAPDRRLGEAAKRRSIHNNYITFPVLFIMISNHYPSTYGSRLNWAVLGILILGGATVRHFMNIRYSFRPWLPALLTTIFLTLAGAYALSKPSSSAGVGPAAGTGGGTQGASAGGAAGAGGESSAAPVVARVAFPVVQAIVQARCTSCHSSRPTDTTFVVAPVGVMLDTPAQIQSLAARIQARVVETHTMPFANKSGMTDEERALLGRWIQEGARTD